MSTGGATGTGPFRAAYAAALLDYLLEPTETSLRVAYELAREAVSRSFSVLDLAVAHQEALMSVLADASDAVEAQAINRAAGDFFLEGLSTFEMVQRGFAEARQAALLERRQTRLSRQLSTFLTDASLALDASGSLEEMLRLVAEQARELIGAECCVATVALGGVPRAGEAASYPEDERRWSAFIQWLDLLEIYRLVGQSGGSARIAGEQLAHLPPFCAADSARPLRGWLAASLTALDGSPLGAIQLFDKHGRGFTVDDEAALVHLAQMTSAAVERARLYQERG
jgi:phosphoserine phosphatase RsbU-like protein/GAF domain-containing protein